METDTKGGKAERKQDQKVNNDNSDEASTSKKQKGEGSRTKPAPGEKPAPKRNAFFNFLDSQRSIIKGSSQKEIVRRAGEMWRKLTAEEKKPYYDMADLARDNPKPVRKTLPTKRKTKQSATEKGLEDKLKNSRANEQRAKKTDREEQVKAGVLVKS